MNLITEVGSVKPSGQSPLAQFKEPATGSAEQAVASQNAQALNATRATPQAGNTSEATGSQTKLDTALARTVAEADRLALPERGVGGSADAESIVAAQAQSTVQRQVAFLVAPPFDGEPSARRIAEADTAGARMRLVMEAFAERAETAAREEAVAPATQPAAAAEQVAAVSIENPADGAPV